FFFFQAEDGIRDFHVTGVQTCALPILTSAIRIVIDAAPRNTANASTCAGCSVPVASGRLAVRTITLSMRWSIRWLIAAAEAAAKIGRASCREREESAAAGVSM